MAVLRRLKETKTNHHGSVSRDTSRRRGVRAEVAQAWLRAIGRMTVEALMSLKRSPNRNASLLPLAINSSPKESRVAYRNLKPVNDNKDESLASRIAGDRKSVV